VYKGYDASAQYDRVFRIAALNRQIQAMSRRHERQEKQLGTTDESILKRITQAEGRRARLVQILRAKGAV